MRKLIFLLIFAFSFISPVKAQNCKVLPTCEELGYNKTVSQCAGIEYLTCPFDETKVYCPSTDPCDDYEDKTCTYGCASYYSDCPSKCKTCDTAPSDPCDKYSEKTCELGCKIYYSDCSTACWTCCSSIDFTGYPLTYCPSSASGCYSTTCGTKTKYKIVGCKTGCTQSGDTCVCS